MRRRTQFTLLFQSSIFGAVTLLAGSGTLDSRAFAQEAAFKQKEAKLKTPKEIADKASEKNKIKNGKSEKQDLVPLEEYYRDYLIPQLTNPSPEVVNSARREFIEDIETIEKNKTLNVKYNPALILQLKEIVLEKAYSPQARINALVLLGKLNSEAPVTGDKKPEPGVQATLFKTIDTKDNDGLLSSTLSTLARHLKANAVNERAKVAFVEKLQAFLTSPAPVTRDIEAHNYLTEQVLECLTLVARQDADSGKQAIAVLIPALVKIVDSQESEWLVETALLSFGAIKTAGMTPEDSTKLEKAIARFARHSIKEWQKKVTGANAMANGFGGYGGGGFSGGPPGGEMGGPSGGKFGGGAGMSSPEGGGGDGYGGGMFGGGGAPNKKSNPFESQPKEVKNARRIAHQRFERIHFALNGTLHKPAKNAQPTTPAPEEKGLLPLLAEKKNTTKLLADIELLQEELNDSKVVDLPSLNLAVTKSSKDLKFSCDLILGERKDPTIIAPDEPLFDQP